MEKEKHHKVQQENYQTLPMLILDSTWLRHQHVMGQSRVPDWLTWQVAKVAKVPIIKPSTHPTVRPTSRWNAQICPECRFTPIKKCAQFTKQLSIVCALKTTNSWLFQQCSPSEADAETFFTSRWLSHNPVISYVHSRQQWTSSQHDFGNDDTNEFILKPVKCSSLYPLTVFCCILACCLLPHKYVSN